MVYQVSHTQQRSEQIVEFTFNEILCWVLLKLVVPGFMHFANLILKISRLKHTT